MDFSAKQKYYNLVVVSDGHGPKAFAVLTDAVASHETFRTTRRSTECTTWVAA